MATLVEKMTALAQAISANTAEIIRAFNTKRKDAFNSSDTTRLGGYTLAQIVQMFGGSGNSHVTNTSNPHNTTAAQLDTYTKPEFDVIDESMLDGYIVPVSRWGSMDYLPAGVAGSFEGASSPENLKFVSAQIEDDGTLVILRPGTNGSSKGVYYSYVKNPSTVVWNSTNFVHTNKRYRPPFIPANYDVTDIAGSNKDVIVAYLTERTTGLTDKTAVILTNGSLDDRLHTGAVLGIPTHRPGGSAIIGTDVVHFTLYSGGDYTTTYPIIKITRTPLSTLNGQTTTAYVGVGNVTCTNWYGNQVETDGFRVANKFFSEVPSDKPFILMSPGDTANWTWRSPFHYVPPFIMLIPDGTGKVRVKVRTNTWMASQSRASYFFVEFSFIYNHAARSGVLEPEYYGQNVISHSSVANPTITGPMYNKDPQDAGWTMGNTVHTQVIDRQGNYYAYIHSQGVDRTYLYRSKIDGFTTLYEATAPGKNWTTGRVYTFVSAGISFGSAVGSNLCGPTLLPNNKLLSFGIGRRASGESRFGLIYTTLEGPGYVYSSINNGSLTGYRPSTHREMLLDLAVDQNDYFSTISEVTSANVVRCSTTRYLSHGVKTTGHATVGSDLTLSTPTSIDESVFTTLYNWMVANRYGGNAAEIKEWRAEIIVPQVSAMNPFALFYVLKPDGGVYFFMLKLSIVTGVKDGAITAMSVVSGNNGHLFISTGLGFSAIYRDRTGACFIYETPTTFLIGITSGHNVTHIGNNPPVSYFAKWDKATANFVDLNPYLISYNMSISGTSFFASPTLGFGSCDLLSSTSDSSTKLIFRPLAKGIDGTYTGASPATSTWYVLAAQDVAQGWIVYFNEVTPIFIAGKYFEMGTTNIDLSTITASPANKTFYAYVRMVEGQPQYVITLTEVPETFTNMFIGKIITDNQRITTILFDKVTRLDTFRISTTPIGSAIPVSSGLPNNAGTLEWR